MNDDYKNRIVYNEFVEVLKRLGIITEDEAKNKELIKELIIIIINEQKKR